MAKSKKGKSGGKGSKSKSPKRDKKEKGTKSKKGKGNKKNMEQAKKQAEKDEQERMKREAEEKAKAEKKLAAEMAQRPGQIVNSCRIIQTYDKWVTGKLQRQKKLREWKSFKNCRNIPDFVKLNEINSYMSFWLSELDPPGMKMFLRLSPEVLRLTAELHSFLELPPECMKVEMIQELGLVYRDMVYHHKTYMDTCSYRILENLCDLFDPEEGICNYILSIPEITHALWGNIFQCPDINEHEFEELKFKFKIPEVLLTAAGIYRLLKTEYDHYSDSCMSYFPPGVENALKQSIIDWMEKNRLKGNLYDDLPSPEDEKPLKKTKGKGKKKKKGSKKRKGKKKGKSKGKKKGKSDGDDTDLSELDDEMRMLLGDDEDGGKKKKKKKGKDKKGKKGKKAKGGGGATTDESGVTTTDGETTGEEGEGEEGGTTTGGEEETTDHETDKSHDTASNKHGDGDLTDSTKETKEERRARRRREAEKADDDEDNFDGGAAKEAEDEDEPAADHKPEKKGKKDRDKDKDRDETGDDDEPVKKTKGKKGDSKGKGAKKKVEVTDNEPRAPTSDYDDDDVDKDADESDAKAAESQDVEGKKSVGGDDGGGEQDYIDVHVKKRKGKSKSKKKGNVKKSKKKKKSGKKSKKEKDAERKEEVRGALAAARKSIKKEGKIKTKEGEGKKKKDKKGKKKTKGSEDTLGGGSRDRKASKKDKKGSKRDKSRSKSKDKGKKRDESKGSRGKSKEKEKKAKSKAVAKSKSKPKPKTKPKSKSPKSSKSKSKKDKKGAKSKKGKKGKGKSKKGKKSKKKKGKKGKKGKKTKSKERHKTEAELAKERERAEKAQYIPQLHENELNLRNYTILGGVFNFSLFLIPSQPKQRTRWTVHSRDSRCILNELPFEADYVPPLTPDETMKKTPEEMEREAKEQEEELQKLLMPAIPKLPPTEAELEEEAERQKELIAQAWAEYEVEKDKRLSCLIQIDVEAPRIALWFEPPIPVRWDDENKIWSTEGFYDIRFNESTLQLSFRSVRFGIMGFGHNRWSNLPYQSWEIKPLGKNKVLFSLVAAIAVVEFIVWGDLICLSSLQNVTNSQKVEAALLNRFMKPHHLIRSMRFHGLDLFPEIDSYAYVDGVLVKHFEAEDHLYQCMAVASSAFNFQWSRWNLLAGREKLIYQMRERHGIATPGNYSMVLTTPKRTLKINCTEVSPNYTEEHLEDYVYHADLLGLVKDSASEYGLKVINQTNPHHIEALRVLLASVRPLSFS